MRRAWVILVVLCLLVAGTQALTFQAASQNSATTSTSDKSKSSSPASASEIAAAKASGKVWVNLDSKVYHKGGRWYGKTKNGKFMTTDEAKKAGYKAAKRD
ncbi:MAG TPA: hypothetical protein VN777_04100 [Terriglobales bacterium]|nr:hypothetical protein [Terriglobales bacterium]